MSDSNSERTDTTETPKYMAKVWLWLGIISFSLLFIWVITPRWASARYATPTSSVENNLKQIAQVGQRACIECGLESVTYEQLIVPLDCDGDGINELPYLQPFIQVDHESYAGLTAYPKGGYLLVDLSGKVPSQSIQGKDTPPTVSSKSIITWAY